MVSLNCNAHVDVVELTDRVTHPLGVGGRNFLGGKGGSLNHQVINRDFSWGGSIEFSSHLEEVIN